MLQDMTWFLSYSFNFIFCYVKLYGCSYFIVMFTLKPIDFRLGVSFTYDSSDKSFLVTAKTYAFVDHAYDTTNCILPHWSERSVLKYRPALWITDLWLWPVLRKFPTFRCTVLPYSNWRQHQETQAEEIYEYVLCPVISCVVPASTSRIASWLSFMNVVRPRPNHFRSSRYFPALNQLYVHVPSNFLIRTDYRWTSRNMMKSSSHALSYIWVKVISMLEVTPVSKRTMCCFFY